MTTFIIIVGFSWTNSHAKPFGKDNLKKNIERINQLNIIIKEMDLILGKNMQMLLKIFRYQILILNKCIGISIKDIFTSM